MAKKRHHKKLGNFTGERKSEAELRDKSRVKRSPKDQLVLLDQRLGKDVGATKERTRLLLAIEEAAKAPEKPKKEAKVKPKKEAKVRRRKGKKREEKSSV